MRINGQAVRAAREAEHNRENGRTLSRERLAARIDVSTSTIERIEQERGGPGISATTLYLMAQELGVPIESLFTEDAVA